MAACSAASFGSVIFLRTGRAGMVEIKRQIEEQTGLVQLETEKIEIVCSADFAKDSCTRQQGLRVLK